MNKIEAAVLELKEKLSKIDSVFAVILYGSVARGDYSLRHSDIDILVILNQMKERKNLEKIIQEVGIKHRVKIHPEYQGLNVKQEDQTLLCKMFEEGKVLFSHGIWFVGNKSLGLEAYRLYRFDTGQINKVNRVMFSRALHGRKGLKGMIDGVFIIDSGRGGLFVRKEKFKDVEDFFDRFKVKYKIIKTFYG